MSDIEALQGQVKSHSLFGSGLSKFGVGISDDQQLSFHPKELVVINFGYRYKYRTKGDSAQATVLPDGILHTAYDVQCKNFPAAKLNEVIKRLVGKDLYYYNTMTAVEERRIAKMLPTMRVNFLSWNTSLDALPGGVRDALIDRACNVGSGKFSKIDTALLKDLAQNNVASAAYEPAGKTVMKKDDYDVRAERRAMMEAMVLLGFNMELDRSNDTAKLSGNLPADVINSFLMKMSSSEDGRYWLNSPHVVGGPLLQAIGEYNQIYQENARPVGQAASDGSAIYSPAMNGNPSSSTSRLDWAAAKRSPASIQRLDAEAIAQALQTGGRDAIESGMGTGYLAHPQRGSPGAAVRTVGSVGHPAAHDAGRTEGRWGRHSPRSGSIQPQATRALIQGRSETRGDAKPDPASLTALGGPPYLAVTMATGLGQSGRMVQAAAARLPAWMISGTAGEAG